MVVDKEMLGEMKLPEAARGMTIEVTVLNDQDAPPHDLLMVTVAADRANRVEAAQVAGAVLHRAQELQRNFERRD